MKKTKKIGRGFYWSRIIGDAGIIDMRVSDNTDYMEVRLRKFGNRTDKNVTYCGDIFSLADVIRNHFAKIENYDTLFQ